MKSISKLLIPVSAIMFFIPHVSASELGDALLNTMNANQWSYNASMDMSVKKDMDQDIPFDISATVSEEGGKMGDNYAELGEMNIRVSNIQDMPTELNDLSYVNVQMNYRADYEDKTQTALVQMDTFQVTSDSKKITKVTEMMNQIAKIFTGKAFKMSSKELAEALAGLGMSSEENVLMLNALSGNSIENTMKTFVETIDGLLQSGILIDTVQNTSVRKNSRIDSSQYHVLTFAESINAQQAEILRKTLIKFFEKAVPTMAAQISMEFESLTIQEFTADVNEGLMAMQELNTQVEVEVASGLIQSFYFHMDLKKMDLPMEMNAIMSFDYSKGYPMVVSRDEKNLIDINKIVEGFLSIAELSSSQMSSYSEPSYYEDQTSYYVVLDTIDEIQNYIWDICGDDAGCRRSQVMKLKRELKKLMVEGVVSRQEYKWKMMDLNTLR
jgi:hypothetical protein